jgi:hypothetical protein
VVASGKQTASSLAPSILGYFAPCPPLGPKHTYVFTIHALDVAELPGITAFSSPKEVIAAIDAHTLARASITTAYEKAP